MENESNASDLCKACGLCCTGHLFEWTKLRSAELIQIEKLGVEVYREPGRRGFDQPCPFWDQVCTIYTTTNYPRFCHAYKCDLLNKLINEAVDLKDAIQNVRGIKKWIGEIEEQLGISTRVSFREQILNIQGDRNIDPKLKSKILILLDGLRETFGVDFEIDNANQYTSG